MLTITKLSENGLNFKRFFFPSKIEPSQENKNQSKLLINIPERCPICGNKDIGGTIKIFNQGTTKRDDRTISIQRTNKFINLNICKEHSYLTKINTKREGKIMIFFGLLFVFSIFFFFVALIFPVIGLIIFLIGALYSLSSVGKKQKKLEIIDENIYFNYLLEHSIISIRRSDWAEDFKKLNQCKEYKQGISL